MANDASLPVRRAGLTALKADAALTALVPAASIYPQSPPATPVWPFIKWGAPSGVPVRAPGCVDGSEIIVAVHGFAKPRYESGAMVETAEDHCARLGAALAAALGDKRLALQSGGNATFEWTGHQLLQDGAEADAFHTVQNFRVRVIA
jgi:hypothetical protein